MPDSNNTPSSVVHTSLMQFIWRKSVQNWRRFSGNAVTFRIWR